MPKTTTVGQYLIHRIQELGVNHVFGVPGDYVLGFYDMLVESDLHVVGTCTEAGAGFAADAYARVNGLGVVCITYCVGGLNTINSVAGAYAEKSPMVVISGAGDRRDEDIRKQTQILGGVFDDVVLYEDQCQRGRADGEVLALLREGLQGASRTSRVDEIRGEFLAIDTALGRLQPGDLCLILIDQVEEALEHIARRVAE